MDIKQTRKTQLRRWVTENGTPVAEKSFFSQLLNPESSFGEKAARRLELDYQMGSLFLDTLDAPVTIRPKARHRTKADNDEPKSLASIARGAMVDAEQLSQLIDSFIRSDDEGRRTIVSLAVDTARLCATLTKSTTSDNG